MPMTVRRLFLSLLFALLPLVYATARADSAPDTLALAQEMFPAADAVGAFNGKPPAAPVRLKGHEIGYVFFTGEVLPIPAYSGKPVNCLVGFDLEGRIRGVTIVHHEEPILVVGLSDRDLARFTGQYKHLPIQDDIRIGGQKKPGRSTIDGISGATITSMVINRTINLGVKRWLPRATC